MALLFETTHFIVEAVDRPLIDRNDGGHLAIHPKVRVSTRQELNAKLATELMRLTMIVGDALTTAMNKQGVDIGRINYQDNGNWSVFLPEGPSLHIHIYGRAKSAQYQKYGEALHFPHRQQHPELYDRLQPLTDKDVIALRKEIFKLFMKDQYADALWDLNREQKPGNIKAVLFDVIGTTVIEKDPATITDCFERAFVDQGVVIDQSIVQANRGRDKKEIIDLITERQNLSAETKQKIYQSLVQHVKKKVQNFQAREGAEDLFYHLKENGIKIGLSTGLSAELFDPILDQMGWSKKTFDFIGLDSKRPDPSTIVKLLQKYSLHPRQVIKLGDTIADIQEGKNAGVITAAILAGTQTKGQLEKEAPDYLITDLRDLKEIISRL